MISRIRPFKCLLRSKDGNASSQIWRSVLLRHRSGLVSNKVNYLNMISLCILATIGRKNRCLWLIGLMVYADPQFLHPRVLVQFQLGSLSDLSGSIVYVGTVLNSEPSLFLSVSHLPHENKTQMSCMSSTAMKLRLKLPVGLQCTLLCWNCTV